MNNPLSKIFMVAVFIYVLTISTVWADRILIDDPEQTVTVSDTFSCYRPVDITIDTTDPGLYETDSVQLQKLGDGVRAMLGYECPGLSIIQLTGLIRGLDDIVYHGEMSKNNDWLVESLQTLDQEFKSIQSDSSQAGVTKRYDDELKQGQLDVTGLYLGMSVDQVNDIVIKTFGVEPNYDAEKGMMTMSSGQCPSDLSLVKIETENSYRLKCLQAWFSDNRVARLQRLTLLQVVDGQIDQVNDLLVSKYGSPMQTNTTANNTETQMIWRAIDADNEQTMIQEIDAFIRSVDSNRIATNVTLYNTQVENNHEEKLADLDLKL